MSEGEEILERIQRRMQKLDMSEYAIRKALGTDLVRSIRTGLAKGIQNGVSSRTINRLAPVLRTTPEWLLSGDGVEDTGIAKEMLVDEAFNPAQPVVLPYRQAERSSVESADVTVPRPLTFPRDVPVHGTAAGSIINKVEGTALDRDIVDYVRRPPAMMERRDIYALYVTGTSMEPLHRHGDLLFLDPKRRPGIGDSVVVVTRTHDNDPGQAYIKILVKRTPNSVVLRQLNPEALIEIPERFIIQTHLVLTMNDLLGS